MIASVMHDSVLIITLDNLEDELVRQHMKKVEVAFVQGVINNTICSWLHGHGIELIICSRQPRRLHSSWIITKREIEHWVVGGVTNHSTQFFCLSRYPLRPRDIQFLSHSRDASTIIDDAVWCSRRRRKPTPQQYATLKVRNIGSSTSSLYHIGGLLPWTELIRCTIITPSLGGDNTSWGVRQLTLKEVWSALDITHKPLAIIPRNVLRSSIPGLSWFAIGMWCGIGETTVQPLNVSSKRLKMDVFSPLPLGSTTNNSVSDLQIKSDNQSAVKSDDATVHIGTWLDHLVHGGVSFRLLLLLVLEGVL